MTARSRRKAARGPLLGRLLLGGGAVCLFASMGCAMASHEPSCARFEGLLSLAAVLVGATAIALLVAWVEEDARRTQDELDRFFGVDESRSLGAHWERWPRPPRKPRPKILDEPQDSAYWMKRLAKRYAALGRLEAVNAPNGIIETQRRMIRDAIAQLSPADALAVMRSWPELAADRGKKGRPTSTPGESN